MKSKSTSINLPPPSIPKMDHMSTNPPWQDPPQQSEPPNLDPSKDIAVLGADIIAETFGGMRKKAPLTPLMEDVNRVLGPPKAGTTVSRPLLPSSTPTPLLPPPGPDGGREFPNRPPDFNQSVGGPPPPDKLEWNPRLGIPPPPRKLMGAEFGGPGGWPDSRPPPPGPGHSPFSWQRDRRPSYEDDRSFQPDCPPPQNPYVYHRPGLPEKEPLPPPHQQLQRDPRLPPGDPRRGAQPKLEDDIGGGGSGSPGVASTPPHPAIGPPIRRLSGGPMRHEGEEFLRSRPPSLMDQRPRYYRLLISLGFDRCIVTHALHLRAV